MSGKGAVRGEVVEELVRTAAELHGNQEILHAIEYAATSCMKWGIALQTLFVEDSLNMLYVRDKQDKEVQKQVFGKIERDLRQGKAIFVQTRLPGGTDHVFTIVGDEGEARICHAWQNKHGLREERSMPIEDMVSLLEKLPTYDYTKRGDVAKVLDVRKRLWGSDHMMSGNIGSSSRTKISFNAISSGAPKKPLTAILEILGKLSIELVEWHSESISGRSLVSSSNVEEMSGTHSVSQGAETVRYTECFGAGLEFVFGVGGTLLSNKTSYWEEEGIKTALAMGVGESTGAAVTTSVKPRAAARRSVVHQAGSARFGLLENAEALIDDVGQTVGGLFDGFVGQLTAGKPIDMAMWDEGEDSVIASYKFFGWQDVVGDTLPIKSAQEIKDAYLKMLDNKPSWRIRKNHWATHCTANLMVLLRAMFPGLKKMMTISGELRSNSTRGAAIIGTAMYCSSFECVQEISYTEDTVHQKSDDLLEQEPYSPRSILDNPDETIPKKGSTLKTKEPAEPKHNIVYSREVLDHTQTFTCVKRPRNMIITIMLPGVKSANCMDLNTFERCLTVECGDPLYKLDLSLSYPVDYENSRAKFNKAKEILTVTIPVLPQPGPVSIASDEWVVDVSDENVVTVSLLTKDGIEIWEKFSLVGQTTDNLTITEATVQSQAQTSGINSLLQSLAITEYFRDLSLQMAQVLPDKLVHHLEFEADSVKRLKGIHAMMSDVLHMTDIVDFLCAYIPRIPAAAKQHDVMIIYNAVQAYYDKATHLDKKDMFISTKKGVLNRLFDLVQQLRSDELHKDNMFRGIKEQLTNYDKWICQLTCRQRQVRQLLELSEQRPLTLEDFNPLIKMDESLEEQASFDDILALLRRYGVIDLEYQPDKENPRVVTIKAANLSLCDILRATKLVDFRNRNLKEIRFLCTECFYMDASTDDLWASRNIAIRASMIQVMDHCRIDVSGMHGDNAPVHKADDGKVPIKYGPGGSGSDGAFGTPGKSGGNIWICTDKIIHAERLTLRSCGGNGGNGQHGGHGQSGIREPSESDKLNDPPWPKHFAFFVGNHTADAQKKILDKLYDHGYSNQYYIQESSLEHYVYSEAPNGVRILFATVDNNYFPFYLSRYGFLLARSKDGVSADGGNAGKGGNAGGGGKAGKIEITKPDKTNYVSLVNIEDKGKGGEPGEPGDPGNRGVCSIAERKKDSLLVAGAGFWGTNKTYRDQYFIKITPWKHKSKDDLELGAGYYYCRHEVSRTLDPLIDNDKIGDRIGFFRTTKEPNCPTKQNRQAKHGKDAEKGHITETTLTASINKAAIHINYQLLSNQALVLQDRDALLQSLEQLEHELSEKLQELETTHQKQHHKQVRHVNHASGNSSVDVVDITPVAKGTITDPMIPFEPDKLFSVVDGNPWISQDDKMKMKQFFQSNEVSIQDKYSKIKEIIQDQLDALRQRMEDENKEETSRLKWVAAHVKEVVKQLKPPTFSRTDSGHIYRMLDAIFVPIVRVMYFEHTLHINSAVQFLSTVREKSHSQLHSRVDEIIATVNPILFKHYRWCVLAEIHEEHIATIPYADSAYQSKAVAVYRKLTEQKSIKHLDTFASSLDERRELKPFNESLTSYGRSCDATMPLSRSTQEALEFLLDFINEANASDTVRVYVPDILWAVQEEYATFRCTISDSDLLFVMTYLQDKLIHLMDQTQLKDLFCDDVLSKVKDHTLEKEGYIIFKGQTYRIDRVSEQSDHQVSITMKCKDSDETWEEWLKDETHWAEAKTLHLQIQADRATLDDKPIVFPNDQLLVNDELLVSPIDINEVCQQLQQIVKKEGWNPDDRVLAEKLDTLSLPHYKDQLFKIARRAHEAQDIPFDVFSFFPPSQWVEQLILYAVRRQHQDHISTFVADVRKSINGLSHCVDKTLYFTFFNQFLLNFTFANEHHCRDVSETLKVMKSVFIDRHLCTLVTRQGIAQAWSKSSHDTEAIFSDLEDMGLIDSTGAFLSYVTPDTLQSFSTTRDLSSPPYLNTVYTMQRYTHDLSDKEISFWSHKIHELRLRLDLQELVNGDIVCDEMLMYAQLLVRHYGDDAMSNVMRALSSKKEGITTALLQELIESCARKDWIFDVVITQLNTSGTLPEIMNCLRDYKWEFEYDQQRNADEIIESIKTKLTEETRDCLSDKLDAITTKLDHIKAIENEPPHRKRSSDDVPVQNFLVTPICNYTEQDIKDWADAFKESSVRYKRTPIDHPLFAEAFAVIRRGVTLYYETEKHKPGITPRDTQMVASLLFFQNLSGQDGAWHGTRLMQQISTGEGKTMIITMTAIFKALLGEVVDIVTSSSVLATRDAADQKPLYSLFGVSVSHCCHEEHTKRQQAYKSAVIYGDIGSFQRDILETKFYSREIRADHDYDNVIIDEVDSMLVDKGETMLYLPHALPDLNALDQVYLEIWTLVNAQDFIGFPNEQEQLRDVLKRKLFGGLSTTAFTRISDITIEQSEDIHRHCISMKVIDPEDHCLTEIGRAVIDPQCGKKLIPPSIDVEQHPHIEQEIILIIQEHFDTVPPIQTIPKVLHSFVKKSLKAWIQSAVNAKYFQPNKQYIIDIDHRESAADRYPKIIIMDNETGVEQESSEWGSGLHQFLQLKHNLRLSTESLKAVYMSNISFFTPRYRSIMGVTGTLGSTAEHTLLIKLYKNIQLVVLPTNKPSRLRINPPVCCPTPQKWEKAIEEDVQEKLQRRAVLLICEDVERAKHLHQHFNSFNPELYTSSHQEKLEETGDSQPGRLIIATNLAGRGTDLKLSKSVKDSGGLHVCLSYLPPNVRVEQQAYGRAARSGDPGSCKMIFHDKQGDLSYAIRKRDLCEVQRVADIEADYSHNILFQEELFKKFKKEYKTIRNKHKENESKGRYELDYCLDCWAYFLDRYTDVIESLPNKSVDERKFEKARLQQAFKKEVENEVRRMALSPARWMQKGHSYMKQAVKRRGKYKDAEHFYDRDYETAIEAYEEAKKQNPRDPFVHYYLAAAKFNKAFRNKNTMVVTGKDDRRDLKQAFYRLIPLFQDKIKQCRTQITTLQLANRDQDQSITGGAQYFDEQKQHEIEVYHQFITTMQDVTGKEITPETFNHADWNDQEAVVVCEMVKETFSLKDCRVSKHYHDYRKSKCYNPRLDSQRSDPERLKALFDVKTSYHTYQSKIDQRIQSLMKKTPVTKDDFMGVFPDKRHFWDQLKRERLITHELVPVALPTEERTGYWNPSIDRTGVQFESWDCIDVDSFDWIQGLSEHQKKAIVSHLKTNNVLNQKGQLIDLDLSKPIDLPTAYTPYYKQIKNTLWIQSIYRFVLDDLHKCVVIDMTDDIDDSSSHTAIPYEPPHEAISETSSLSVVDILIRMNPKANASSASDVQHFQVSSDGKATPHTSSASFTKVDHIPNETLNQEFKKQLEQQNLCVTNVSGDELNCLIHAMIQHAKRDYQKDCFKEDADTIRKQLQEQHPEVSDLNDMLHTDDHSAETILNLVNDHCHATIRMVSVVIASSDGPIIYGGTHDKRLSTGRHVVIWQQGNHYVSIVRHQDMVRIVPKLTQLQCSVLEALGMIKMNEGGIYQICEGLDKLEHVLQSEESSILSTQDKKQIRAFLRFKLEIDFKTLNHSPRELEADQHHVLYDDLCQYALIKPVKMKRDADLIEVDCYNKFGYKSHLRNRKPYFNVTVMNDYLKQKLIKEIKEETRLVTYLQDSGIVTEPLQEPLDEAANFILTLNKPSVLARRLVDKAKTAASTSVQTVPDAVKEKPSGSTHRVLKQVDELTPELLQSATFLTAEQQDGVKGYLRLMIHLKEDVDTIIATLKSQQSTVRELETPEITLRKLTDVFEESVQDKGDVLGWFTDNQCDLIIDLAEQKWSWKSITVAICAIALGVAQIALGAVLEVVSLGSASFICGTLISEGISDMIFGIEGLVKGHCNWSEYFDNKIMSLAISIATAGVGALFARGKEVSKYAYKAFGAVSMELAEATAKETGKNVSKVMAKEVTKTIGKEVAGAVVDAGMNLAVEKIVEQLSQAIDSASASIVECFNNMWQDEELQRKMSTFLQKENPDTAAKQLHDITTRILQQSTFLDLWDTLENCAQKGASVLTGGHGNATSKLQMRGDKVKGQRLMKGIGYVSRFAPLVTEILKGAMTKFRMDGVKNELECALEQHVTTKHGKTPLDEATIDQIKKDEIAAMKKHFSEELAQRGKKIATTGLNIVSQELKKQSIKFGKERVVAPLREHIDISKLNNYERKLAAAAKSDDSHSQIEKYKGKMKLLMERTRSPEVFARMIENHDALLGPAFAVPTLEKIVGRPVRIVTETEDGKTKPILDVHEKHVQGDPIEVKFIPEMNGQPGHYYFGGEKFTPQQDGNNCLIHAVLAGAGRTDMDAHQVRKDIAKDCRDPKHPCHGYIKRGIARNYVRIGVVGGAVKFEDSTLSGKAGWYLHTKRFLVNEWNQNFPDDKINMNTKLGDKDLHRCHRMSEYVIHRCLERAINPNVNYNERVGLLNELRQKLLPTVNEVGGFDNSKFKTVFDATYTNDSDEKKTYEAQVERVTDLIGKWPVNGQPPDNELKKLATDLSNSPFNVSLGQGRTNSFVNNAADLNPGSPSGRSQMLQKTFENIPEWIPQKLYNGVPVTSFDHGNDLDEIIEFD